MIDTATLVPHDPWLLVSFVAVMLALNFTPGPAIFKVVSDALGSGLSAAHASIAGIFAANFFYAVLAATGVAVLVYAFPGVLLVIKWLGLAYIASMILGAVKAAWQAHKGQIKERPNRAAWRLFLSSFALQVSNPTSLLSFGLMLPTFAGPGEGLALRMLTLAVLSLVLEYPAMLFYAGLASWSARALAGPRFSIIMNLASALFLGLAWLLIAMTDFAAPVGGP